MQVIQMVKNKKETSGNDLDWEFQVPGQCLPGVVCSRRRPRQWGAKKYKRGEVNIKPCGGYKQSTFFAVINKIINQQPKMYFL